MKQPTSPEITALLLDIEGTTTPVEFVYQTLFPYAREHMAEYLRRDLTREDRDLLRAEHAAEVSPETPAWAEPPIAYLLWLINQDRKSRGLKSVQGKIWARCYTDGSLRSVVFPDVAPALRQWKSAGKRVYIYSSGSVMAQRLLFGYTVDGDLTPLIDGYFDSEVGPKRDPESYRRIARATGMASANCLFVSDMAAECAAARAAGFQALLSVRPGNARQDGEFPSIGSFEELGGMIRTLFGC